MKILLEKSFNYYGWMRLEFFLSFIENKTDIPMHLHLLFTKNYF